MCCLIPYYYLLSLVNKLLLVFVVIVEINSSIY